MVSIPNNSTALEILQAIDEWYAGADAEDIDNHWKATEERRELWNVMGGVVRGPDDPEDSNGPIKDQTTAPMRAACFPKGRAFIMDHLAIMAPADRVNAYEIGQAVRKAKDYHFREHVERALKALTKWGLIK